MTEQHSSLQTKIPTRLTQNNVVDVVITVTLLSASCASSSAVILME